LFRGYYSKGYVGCVGGVCGVLAYNEREGWIGFGKVGMPQIVAREMKWRMRGNGTFDSCLKSIPVPQSEVHMKRRMS
jgi:hypothetical protein